MQVLVLEDDVIMQELLSTLVRGQNSAAHLHLAETVEAGLEFWRSESIDLVVCDWNLRGHQSGMELVKHIRAQNTDVPIVIITGQSDRTSVINGMRYNVNEFVVKPFDPKTMAERLHRYMENSGSLDRKRSSTLPSLVAWVDDFEGLFERLSVMSGTHKALDLLQDNTQPSVRDLARIWAKDPAITACLVRLANSSLMRRYGKSVSTLLEAIGALGVETSINQVIAVSLKDAERLEHSYLKQLAVQYADEAAHIAERAATLAQKLKLNVAQSYTAGLMVRLGEQVLLDAIQQYLDAGGNATLQEMDAALTSQAMRYGNQLKIKWHLPLSLRERVGATYKLPENSVNPELILMRVAACLVHRETKGAEFERLIRRLGLEESEL